jgi:hypothetical protein
VKFLEEHGTKLYGAATALLGTLATLISTGAFEKLMTVVAIGWLNIFVSLATAAVGGMTIARGFNNSTAVKIAGAMETAIKAQPGQGGFVRPLLLALLLAIAVPAVLVIQGCATNPDGSRELTPEGQAILETSTRIAVRHYVADSPRAAERVQNLREVVAKLQELTSAETTLGALKAVVVLEVERLNLAPLDKADALDLLDLFAAALDARLGQDPLQEGGLVRVNAFLDLVLAAIPEVQPVT